MLYCTKCKTVCEAKNTTCPNCKRSKSLREAKDEDMVFFDRLGEVDAYEISVLLEENAIKYELHDIPLSLSESTYDATKSRTDRNLYVEYRNIENARKIINDYYFSTAPEIAESPADEKPEVKNIVSSSAFIILFMVLVGITVLFTDSIANFIRSLFGF
ncbi:MAG: hypothetical protein J6M16_06275 [Clostridia bacterium]|nr:hypothetical protein [Clostridia bacterium]